MSILSVSGSGFNTWLSKQPYITNGGLKHKYKLEQFHLHWAAEDHYGSEHKIGGLSYAAEVRLSVWVTIHVLKLCETVVNVLSLISDFCKFS